MLNKEETKNAINNLPEFELVNVAVRQKYIDASNNQSVNWYEQKDKAVVEKGTRDALTYVTPRYNLFQFKDIFMPIVNSIEEFEADLIYYNGMGSLVLFPKEDDMKIGDDKIGLTLINSVNKTSSIIVKFCVKHKDNYITFPNKIAGFKQMHSGMALNITQNYLAVISKIKDIWKIVVDTFGQKVDRERIEQMIKDVGFDKQTNLKKKIIAELDFKEKEGEELTIWGVFMHIIREVNKKDYKSDYHKQKKLDTISEKIFKNAVIQRLI